MSSDSKWARSIAPLLKSLLSLGKCRFLGREAMMPLVLEQGRLFLEMMFGTEHYFSGSQKYSVSSRSKLEREGQLVGMLDNCNVRLDCIRVT